MELSKISLAFISVVALALLLQCTHAQDTPQDILDAHNNARATVGVPGLTWDDTNLAAFAQNYADSHIDDCSLVHSNGRYGENLAGSSVDLTVVDAVNMWVNKEKAFYDYNSNSCAGGECMHYTQVVWSNSERVGCAKVMCNNGAGTFIGCNYDPPGNVAGQRPY